MFNGVPHWASFTDSSRRDNSNYSAYTMNGEQATDQLISDMHSNKLIETKFEYMYSTLRNTFTTPTSTRLSTLIVRRLYCCESTINATTVCES